MHKKNIFSLLATLVLLICYIFTGCGDSEPTMSYEDALLALSETTLNEDGSYQATEELLVVLENTEYVEPKNIILMIGDGMGFNILEATEAEYSAKLYQGTLSMNHLPLQSSQCTYSTSSAVTDSAAGATALATGYKTGNGVVSMDSTVENEYKTILEIAAEKGKSTGVVATKDITDATPAAFTAHAPSRSHNLQIAGQQLEKLADGTLDVVLGGGSSQYENASNAETMADAKKSGLTYTNSWRQAQKAHLPLAGLFEGGNLNTADDDTPTLAEMTDLALSLLADNEEGFFLMVEGSQIDTAGHDNNLEREMKEAYDFDCAIAVAMKYVALHPDTVLIVTADHETGGLQMLTDPSVDNNTEFVYTTGNHTGVAVPVLAVGYGTETLSGINENVDIAVLMAEYLGIEDFGCKSKVHSVWDADNKKNTVLSNKNNTFVMPKDLLSVDLASGESIKAFHVTMKNQGKNPVRIPSMNIMCGRRKHEMKPQISYIYSGEELVVNYMLPEQFWNAEERENIDELNLYINDSEAMIQISEICVSVRPSDR